MRELYGEIILLNWIRKKKINTIEWVSEWVSHCWGNQGRSYIQEYVGIRPHKILRNFFSIPYVDTWHFYHLINPYQFIIYKKLCESENCIPPVHYLQCWLLLSHWGGAFSFLSYLLFLWAWFMLYRFFIAWFMLYKSCIPTIIYI
jgi:hypothetical protein